LFVSTIIAVLFSFIYQFFNLSYLHASIVNKEIQFPFEFNFISKFNYETYDYLRIIFLVPILEELFYRYILQNRLNKIFSPFIAILLSSILFSIGHFNLENFSMFLIAGVLLGYSYHYTKNISIAIYTHILINFLITFTVITEPITNFYIGMTIIMFIVTIIILLIYKYKVQLNEN